MAKEIEKKWVLKKVPQKILENTEKIEITQFYTKITPEEEERYRTKKIGDKVKYIRTVKKGTGLVREEIEKEVTIKEFEAAKDRIIGNPIVKTRYKTKDGFEIDIYENFKGLIVIEKEFPNKEAVEKFEMPDWLKDAIDVTENKEFKNKNLALKGVPKIKI